MSDEDIQTVESIKKRWLGRRVLVTGPDITFKARNAIAFLMSELEAARVAAATFAAQIEREHHERDEAEQKATDPMTDKP